MRLTSAGSPHLTYCTNVHAGEGWADVRAAFEGPIAAVARRVAGESAFGVGLRVAARAARELRAPMVREELRDVLRRTNAYVFTVNAFPYGAFHAEAVKRRVYRPDWRERARGEYTRDVADLLAALLPDGMVGSISTVPGADAARAKTAEERDGIAARLLETAADLVAIERRTGKRLILALEPEPACMLETARDAARFFVEHVLARSALTAFAESIGCGVTEAEGLARRHLGVCLDACHSAVGFETAADALSALAREGIVIAKVQLSAGIEVEGRGAAMEVLPALDDGVYLHQTTVARRDASLIRFDDLGEALATAPEGIWRVHVHVPIDREPKKPLGTTRRDLEALLACLRVRPVSAHLEVETYTWSVLPSELRGDDLVEDIARELAWARRMLEEDR